VSSRPISARTRLAWFTAAVVMVIAGLAIIAVTVAMALIPTYQFPTTVTEVGTHPGLTGAPGDGTVVMEPPGTIPITDTETLIRSMVLFGAAALLLVAAAAIWAGWMIAGRTIGPLQQIAAATRLAADGSLRHRIRLQRGDKEFRQLADSVDDMLEQLERSFAARERFAANASHELRSPLATTTLLIDVAREREIVTDADWVERLEAANTRVVDLIGALLTLADVTSTDPALAPVDLALLARSDLQGRLFTNKASNEAVHGDGVMALGRNTEMGMVRLETDLRPAVVAGDELLISRIVANLVDNAVRHNQDGGFVTVRTAQESSWGVLEISNSGGDLGPAVLERLAEPFYRVKGRGTRASRFDGPESHGLGLALVAAIVDSHHGTLQLQARPQGGLVATVRLPRPG
jgi:two-component system sensor histidine kinase VanS